MNRKQLIEEIAADFHAIKNKMSSFARSGVAGQDRITHSQQFALFMISQCKDSGIKEISKMLCTSSSASTQLVNELVKQGLVIRKTNLKDRRALDLTISQKGKQQIMKARKMHLKIMSSLFDPLTDKELKLFINLNKKILS